MQFIYQYDIAALFISVLILFNFLIKKRITTRVSAAFLVLTSDLIAAIIFELLSIFTITYYQMVPVQLNMFINVVALLTYNALPPLFYFSVFAATTNQRKHFIIPEKYGLLIPAIISSILILTTPFTKLIIYFDEEGRYHSSKFFDIITVIGFIYLVMVIIRAIRKKYKLNNMQFTSIILYTATTIISVAIQVFKYTLLLPLFFASLTVLLVYLSLDNPLEYVDQIMNIYNKKSFTVVLNKLYNKKKKFRLIGIKLEQIQYINETIGYGNFNALLEQLRDRIIPIAGKENFFRVSNGKFAIIVDEQTDFNAILICIQKMMEREFDVNGMIVTLRYKITTLESPDKSTSTSAVIDLLCYTLDSPQAPIGAITIADSKILDKAKREHKLIKIMKDALEHNGFSLFYQPIYSVEMKTYTSAEALLRLNDPELGFISPEEFIPLAEKNGMILQIGDFVFNSVCEFIALNNIWETDIKYIHVNLSAVQCMSDKLYEKLFHIMDGYGIPYKYIHLEVSETTAAMTSDSLRKNMYMCMNKDVYFALDDSGAVFGNSAKLLQYPFKTVKLDKTVIWKAMEDEKAMKLVAHTIAMLKDLNINIVAEGIETEEQAELFKKLDCNYFQGFYYSKPIRSEDFFSEIAKLEK